MTTSTLNPTYYQVTWTLNSPTDYSSLTGSQSGGLDNVPALKYNRQISATGATAISTTVMNAGETIIINGYTVTFSSSDALTDIINKINLFKPFTNIIADQRVAATYITLSNAPGCEGNPFYLSEGNGTALYKLGLTAQTYSYYPNMICSSFANVGSGTNVTINGANVVFSSGNLSTTVTQLNSQSIFTGVAAYVAGPYVQLASTTGQAWSINSGTAVGNLGITTGNFAGYPTTITQSQYKEQALMRWELVLANLESVCSPIFVGNVAVTGNFNGNAAPTTFSFTIGYDQPTQVTTTALSTEPDSGTVYTGTTAIARFVARAMNNTFTKTREIFDPTTQSYGAYANLPNAIRIQTLTAGALDTNVITLQNNISVTQVLST